MPCLPANNCATLLLSKKTTKWLKNSGQQQLKNHINDASNITKESWLCYKVKSSTKVVQLSASAHFNHDWFKREFHSGGKKKSWARENRKIWISAKTESNLDFRHFSGKSCEEYLTSRYFFIEYKIGIYFGNSKVTIWRIVDKTSADRKSKAILK